MARPGVGATCAEKLAMPMVLVVPGGALVGDTETTATGTVLMLQTSILCALGAIETCGTSKSDCSRSLMIDFLRASACSTLVRRRCLVDRGIDRMDCDILGVLGCCFPIAAIFS